MAKQTYDSVPGGAPREKASESATRERSSLKRILGIGVGLAVGTMLVVAGLTSATVRSTLGMDSLAVARDSRVSAPARLGTGTSPVTFTVHLCGVPKEVWNRHVPWPVCRVKLVGCPSTGNCWHWRYHQGIEMTPTDASRNTFTVTTSEYGAGDSFGFALVEAGCTTEDEAPCVGDREDAPEFCKTSELCDHRYDSGTAQYTTAPGDPQFEGHNVTCWKDKQRCSSASPFFFMNYEQRTCLREPGGPWFNRVLPGDAVAQGAYSAVWGSCESEPTGEAATKCMNAAGKESMCPALEKPIATRADPVEPDGGCFGKPDGTFATIEHTEPGFESVELTATCCGGEACGPGKVCLVNGQCGAIDPMPAPGFTGAVCPSGNDDVPGMCTQSCGTGNGDCDQTCAVAAEMSGYALDCVVGGSGNDKCRCSNVGGGTAEECMFFPNPGWKCCTCMSLVTPQPPPGNSANAPGRNRG